MVFLGWLTWWFLPLVQGGVVHGVLAFFGGVPLLDMWLLICIFVRILFVYLVFMLYYWCFSYFQYIRWIILFIVLHESVPCRVEWFTQVAFVLLEIGVLLVPLRGDINVDKALLWVLLDFVSVTDQIRLLVLIILFSILSMLDVSGLRHRYFFRHLLGGPLGCLLSCLPSIARARLMRQLLIRTLWDCPSVGLQRVHTFQC